MNKINNYAKLILPITLFLLLSCFPSKKATQAKKETINSLTQIKSPTKIYLFDASVLLFPTGFIVKNDTVWGKGQRYWIDKKDEKTITRKIPLDSIATMTYYELAAHTGGEQFGSFLLGLYGGILTPLSIYCLSCPKCCFGSCPTLYIYDGNNYNLKAELFSYSISKYFQETDLDLLSTNILEDGKYRVRLSNEALETHYINQFSLITVNHPKKTKIFPSNEEDFIIIKKFNKPTTIFNSLDEDVSSLVNKKDNLYYRSDIPIVEKLSGNNYRDWLDITIKTSNETDNLKLILHLKNTLLSTILFYDVVLKSQGIKAVEWVEKMNTNQLYALQFNTLYKAFAGIKVKIYRNDKWEQCAAIDDIGPIAWKEMAVNIPLEEGDLNPEGEVNIRLEFFADNFMIDYISYDSGNSRDSLIITEIFPSDIVDDFGISRNDIYELVQKDDSQFLITNPGEFYDFDYNLLIHNKMETSVFVRSKGYYTEWLRGDWITTENTGYRFNIFEVDKTIAQLKKSWLESRELLETEFFKTRIPLKEGL